jgi:RNA polymerase sigma-70 factor (ECF subfamily)
MDSAETLPLARAAGNRNPVEEVSLRRLTIELYDREHVAIHRYIVFLGLEPETAQEIVQEAFLKLHQHLLAEGDRRNLRAWLYRVAHNMARNTQMARRVRKTEALSTEDVERRVAVSDLSAEEQLLEAEKNRRMREAIAGLSAAQKQCLMLRAQGLKYREIAEALNLSVSTVGENVQRGLEKLKEIL